MNVSLENSPRRNSHIVKILYFMALMHGIFGVAFADVREDFESYKTTEDLQAALGGEAPPALIKGEGVGGSQAGRLAFNGQTYLISLVATHDELAEVSVAVRLNASSAFFRLSFGGSELAWNKFAGNVDLRPGVPPLVGAQPIENLPIIELGKWYTLKLRCTYGGNGKFDYTFSLNNAIAGRDFRVSDARAATRISMGYLSAETRSSGDIIIDNIQVKTR